MPTRAEEYSRTIGPHSLVHYKGCSWSIPTYLSFIVNESRGYVKKVGNRTLFREELFECSEYIRPFGR